MTGTKAEKAAKVRALAIGLMVVALAGVLLAAKPAHAKTFAVNSTSDGANIALDGVCDADPRVFVQVCTLRAAIEEANNRIQNPGADTIRFNIPTTLCNANNGVCTISPASALPTITEQVTINGYTQRSCSTNPAPCSKPNSSAVGTNANLLIQLNGANTTSSFGLFIFGASNSVVKGLVINRFTGGIAIDSNSTGGTTGNRIEGNFIGTNASGTADLGNIVDGVAIDDPNNTVGGTSRAARNLISGNGGNGVAAGEAGTTQVLGNLIGTDRTGTNDLGNDRDGVWCDSSFNTVGDETAASANVIAFNGEDGVTVVNSDSTGNAILRNSIFSNGGLGIDLGNDGRTINDVGDGDSGANNLQNFPVVSSAETVGNTTTIKFRLNSTADTTFLVLFFSNPSNDNEGKSFIGGTSVTTNANGNTGTLTFEPEQRVALGQRITATATATDFGSNDINTSEFSPPRGVEAGTAS
jgi:hypothetical protein